ncbi:MAG: DUF5717 family protein [Clostridiales bacterium]|jgi:hypothetical protein|nr:DUF5717 family protein [Clostridiales bacterium]
MPYKEQFNSPLPLINRETKNIDIETSNSLSGAIIIKNDGGGEIMGRVMSNSSSITFDPEEFSGNDSKITFYINLDYYNPGDILNTNAVIKSNGGEHIIDFTVKVIPHAIETKEGDKITSLKDFYSYCVEYPVAARQLFVSHEFMMWLYTTGYIYMDIYEKFARDSNKERALDNFLVFNNLKSKTKISCYDKSIKIHVYPYYDKIWTGSIRLRKSGWGYVDCDINTEYDYDWFTLSKTRLVSSDFDSEYETEVSMFIDAVKLPKRLNIQYVIIDGQRVHVTVIKAFYIEASTEKDYLTFGESSNLVIRNNSGARLTVDIHPSDNFIKFESVRYYVDEMAKIPFDVQLSTFQKTQMSLLKQPFVNTSVTVEAVYDRQPYFKRFYLKIGDIS